MKVFYLPDLGEGLPEAEIREWLVKEGDHVTEDTPIVAMETAKALVDVPAPFTGIISKFHGAPGDIIKTGDPLVSFDADATSSHEAPVTRKDSGTVVGNIVVGEQVIDESATGIKQSKAVDRIKASPAVRQLAKQLNVKLETVHPTGPSGSITINDVKSAVDTVSKKAAENTVPKGFSALHGVSRSMAINMALAHQQVVPVTLMDDADIQHFGEDIDISVRIIRAVADACAAEPKVNAHYHGKSISINIRDQINLAVAVDTEAGLYAPVIKDIAKKSDHEIRSKINDFKQHALHQDFPPEDLQDATITLSNFGVFVGRYASPVIIPPTVAIIGIGKKRDAVVAIDGKPEVHMILPVSLTVDHRAITGGEAARFLAAFIQSLQQ